MTKKENQYIVLFDKSMSIYSILNLGHKLKEIIYEKIF